MNKKILSIATVVPHNRIGHAGGKTYTYYMTQLGKEHIFDVCVMAFTKKRDIKSYEKINGINYKYLLSSGTLVINALRCMLDVVGKSSEYGFLFSFYKKVSVMSMLHKMKKNNELPDIIQLEWTEMVLLANSIKKRYPSVKLILSEHDVSFQKEQRNYELTPSSKSQKKRYEVMKKLEMQAFEVADCIMPQSYKDKEILEDNGVINDKIFVLTPYYHDMQHIKRNKTNGDILFWGAMYRPENYEAAIWFIENVMSLLSEIPIRFVVAGNNPPDKLKKYASDKVIITGFVEDETSLFENSMCFVSPLLTGAGIKVKVIEALSAGIPVLTNDIGIEGINANRGESYFHCEKPEEYAYYIEKLYNREIDVDYIQLKQREMIKNEYDLEKSFVQYKKMILDI